MYRVTQEYKHWSVKAHEFEVIRTNWDFAHEDRAVKFMLNAYEHVDDNYTNYSLTIIEKEDDF